MYVYPIKTHAHFLSSIWDSFQRIAGAAATAVAIRAELYKTQCKAGWQLSCDQKHPVTLWYTNIAMENCLFICRYMQMIYCGFHSCVKFHRVSAISIGSSPKNVQKESSRKRITPPELWMSMDANVPGCDGRSKSQKIKLPTSKIRRHSFCNSYVPL